MARLTAPRSPLASAPAARPVTGRRGSARARGYTRRWDKASKAFLRAHPLCLGCTAMGRVEGAVLTDHIVPHRGNQALFWDEANWQPSCRWHHDTVKKKLEALYEIGGIGAEDLRLDSATARDMSEREGRGGSKV